VVVGCGLLVALGPPAAQARPRLEGHPKPPSQAQIDAAETGCGSIRRRAGEAVRRQRGAEHEPYQWGGAGPARYDCSGLTMVASAHAGVQLLHYTGYQWQEGPHLPLSQLRRGDLLFYATNTSDPSTIHHVAIYIGNGMMVMNAPYTGALIRIDSMYQPGGLIGAVRPAG
jgi:cell wall-associated NlpC family hydrolase